MDGECYRAVVSVLSEDMVSVNLVDYGHRITLDKNNLRSITPRLLSLPFQAVHCSLAGTFSEEMYLVQDLLINCCIYLFIRDLLFEDIAVDLKAL